MPTQWPVLGPQEFIKASAGWSRPWHENYLVMFSSFWGGFSTHPALWSIPPDDHMVHRGDGVFEAFKCISGKAYCLKEHLERLKVSASMIDLKLPPELDDIKSIISQAYKLANYDKVSMRLTVSRGPGSFSANPYEPPQSQLYLIATKLKQPAPEVYEKGVSLITAPFLAKSEYISLKSCNYLHNVMVKKAAMDAGADYAACFDQDGFLTEGATENLAVVTNDGILAVPSFKRILKGVTLTRVMTLALKLVKDGRLRDVTNLDLTQEQIQSKVKEAFLTTTSFDVLPVVKWDGKPIGDGHPGVVSRELNQLLSQEISEDNEFQTPL